MKRIVPAIKTEYTFSIDWLIRPLLLQLIKHIRNLLLNCVENRTFKSARNQRHSVHVRADWKWENIHNDGK